MITKILINIMTMFCIVEIIKYTIKGIVYAIKKNRKEKRWKIKHKSHARFAEGKQSL